MATGEPGSSYNNYGEGDTLNAPGGTATKNIYHNTTESFDPLSACKQSLAFLHMNDRSHEVVRRDRAFPGTCKWLQEHPTYKEWISSDSGLLWIQGKPGSGKSTLLGHAVRSLDRIPRSDLVISFFFHNRGAELQKTPLGFFRSLLHQLLCAAPKEMNDLVEAFKEKCATLGKPEEKWHWHIDELQQLLESSLSKVLRVRSAWLFVDALDECGKESAIDLITLLQSLPPREIGSVSRSFHMCFSCRHYPVLNVEHTFQICTEHENEEDIKRYVHQKLSSLSYTIWDRITARSNGVFLWAALVVHKVLQLHREGSGARQINLEVESIPEKLYDIYDKLIEEMRAGTLAESLQLIQWTCYAEVPLYLDQLRCIMFIRPGCQFSTISEYEEEADLPSGDDGLSRRIQTLSCGLVEVTPDMTSQFIHQTVKDFFLERGLAALTGINDGSDIHCAANFDLGGTCLRYLATDEVVASMREPTSEQEGTVDMQYEYNKKYNYQLAFESYAAWHWHRHMEHCIANFKVSTDRVNLESMARLLFLLPRGWTDLTSIYDISILHKDMAYRPAEKKLDEQSHVHALHFVSGCDCPELLQQVLARTRQAGMNVDIKDYDGDTPLAWAVANGQEDAVVLLLDEGANINTTALKSDMNDGAATRVPLLSLGVIYQRKAVVLILLARGVSVETVDKSGCMPLHWAAFCGRADMVRELLKHGANIEATTTEGDTPLLIAAGCDEPETVQMLLEHGANIEARTNDGQTPLLAAALYGHQEIVRILLERKADTKAADSSGETPHSIAESNVEIFPGVLNLLQRYS